MFGLMLAVEAVPNPDFTTLAVLVITGLGAAVSVLTTWLLRLALATKVPKIVWPIVALVLGWVSTYVGALIAGGTLSPIPGALAGLSAIVIRDWLALLKEQGIASVADGSKIKLI